MPDLILLAMDGSPASKQAAKASIEIAKKRNLIILGLYVVDEAFISDPQSDILAELGTNELPTSKADLLSRFVLQGQVALNWLEKCCHESNVIASTNILFGSVTETIIKEADRASLVALGRRGHTHISDQKNLGLNFRSIALHTKKPLLVGGEELRPIKRVLAALRGGSGSEETVKWAANLQRTLDFELITLAVTEEKDESPGTRLQIDNSGVQNQKVIHRKGQPAEEIINAAEENRVDLVIMGHYRNSTLDEWLTGSIPDQVLRLSHIPVIIV